jgi:hypothetical protein
LGPGRLGPSHEDLWYRCCRARHITRPAANALSIRRSGADTTARIIRPELVACAALALLAAQGLRPEVEFERCMSAAWFVALLVGFVEHRCSDRRGAVAVSANPQMPCIELLQTIPGVAPKVAETIEVVDTCCRNVERLEQHLTALIELRRVGCPAADAEGSLPRKPGVERPPSSSGSCRPSCPQRRAQVAQSRPHAPTARSTLSRRYPQPIHVFGSKPEPP